jgi:formylglycine-generating enzyme required for sulfatase activity
MNRTTPLLAAIAVLLVSCPLAASAVTIDTVPVGNAGNSADPTTGLGSVDHDYRIAATEVTNGQYVEFLNAKAKTDTYFLYNLNMDVSARSGIQRSGSNGNFTYFLKPNMGDKPVNFVSWYSAIRFSNWLHNGQGTGDTETGAYTLNGVLFPSNVTRNAGATWFLPSEDEWYKAAYHQPAAQGGDSDDYWAYPTRSNSVPTMAAANIVGDISNPGANVANYGFGADWNSLNGNYTTVGSAGPMSASFYGTSDQGGNAVEWNETVTSGSVRMRAGYYFTDADSLLSSSFDSFAANGVGTSIGFRVATVPEPTTFALAALGMLGIVACARRRSRRAGRN